MPKNKGYKALPVTANRLMVKASATIGRRKNTIHAIVDVDISVPRNLMQNHFVLTGEKLSLTAYIVACLAKTIKENPYMNSFNKGRKHIILDDVTVSVLIEREIHDEKVPEPIGIQKAQAKSYRQIHEEIRAAQNKKGDRLGSLSGMGWMRFIPVFLLRTFIHFADKNISMAKRYGKVSVTAVGMFSKEAVWFIPLGGATVLVTVGGICENLILIDNKVESREHLCLTVSFDHNIIDGAPAARFMKAFLECIKCRSLLNDLV